MTDHNLNKLLHDLEKEYGATPSVTEHSFKVVDTSNGEKYETVGIKIHLDLTPAQKQRSDENRDYHRFLILSLVLDKYVPYLNYQPTRLLTLVWSEKILTDGKYVVGKPRSSMTTVGDGIIKKSRMKWKHESGFVVFSNGVWGNLESDCYDDENKAAYRKYEKSAMKVSLEPTNLRNIKASIPLIDILSHNHVYVDDVERLKESIHKVTRTGVQLGLITDCEFTDPYSM